jgi:hypothetical protein
MNVPRRRYGSMALAGARRLDPFDASMLVCLGASVAFAGLTALASASELVHGVALVWPLVVAASALAWLLLDVWCPLRPMAVRTVVALVVYVGVEVLVAAPMVALARELAGLRIVAGASLVAAIVFAALTVFALIKPTTYLEPVDLFVVIAVLVIATVLVGLGLHLPLRFGWGAAAIGLTGIWVLREIANTFAYVSPGEHVAGGTRLFACLSVLFIELLYDFTKLAQAAA